MKAINTVLTILAVMSVLVPALIVSSLLFPRALPWWMDGGDWLKRVNAILGNTYPMWNQTTLQYPPLFLVLVAALSKLIGEVPSLEFWAVIAYCLIPLTSYFLIKELFDDKVVAVAGAWLVGFTPIWFEMLGWGGYPDLLGSALLQAGFMGVLRYRRDQRTTNLTLLVVGGVLIPLTHHLTFLVFAGVLVFWGVLSALFDRGTLKPIAVSLIVTAATFGLYRLAAGPWQFLLSNDAALLYLRATGPFLLYMFKSLALLLILYVTAVASIVLLILEKKYRAKVLLLVSWALTPILGTQGYLLGVALDYNRVLFFFAQPFMILVAVPLIFRSDISKFIRSCYLGKGLSKTDGLFKSGGIHGSNAAKQLLALGVLLLSLLAVITTPLVGATTMANVNAYYSATDVYGDQEKLQVANYLSANTPPTSVVVAETTMGRWIEGISQRRVLLEEDPKYLFLSGELAREQAASAILFSNRGMRNGNVWVYDQAPYGEFSPLISFYVGGEYQAVAALNDSGSSVSWVDAVSGTNHTMALSGANSTTSYWVERTPQVATIGVNYIAGPIEVIRQVSLSSDNGNVSFSFSANSSDPRVSLTSLTVSLEPWQVGLYSANLLSNRTLVVGTSLCNLYFSSSAAQAFPFKFSHTPGSNDISGWVNLWGGQPANSTGLFSYDRAEIIRQYGVTDVVIPKQYLIPVGRTVSTTFRAPPIYENMLKDPEFRIVYYNDRAIVLEFVGQANP